MFAEKEFKSSCFIASNIYYNQAAPVYFHKYISKLDLSERDCTKYIKNAKLIRSCRGLKVSHIRKLLLTLYQKHKKHLVSLPAYILGNSFQERQWFPNLSSMILQFNSQQDWKEFRSKTKLKSILFSSNFYLGEDLEIQINKKDLLSSKLYRLKSHLIRLRQLADISFSGKLDDSYFCFMDTIEDEHSQLNSLNIIRLQLMESQGMELNHAKVYSIYECVRQLEVKSKGILQCLRHFEDNVSKFLNLESLVIKIADVNSAECLSSLSHVKRLEKLKSYFLGLLKADFDINYQSIVSLSLPPKLEKFKLAFLDTKEWDKAYELVAKDQDKLQKYFMCWQEAALLKELHLFFEVSLETKMNWPDLLMLALFSKEQLETLRLEYRIKGIEEDDPSYLQQICSENNMLEFYDFMRNYLKLVPKLSDMSITFPIISLVNIHNYQEELGNLRSLSLRGRIYGSRNIHHLYDLIKLKKGFHMDIAQILIENNDAMTNIIDTIPMMSRNIQGFLGFRLEDEVNEDVFTNSLIKIMKKCKNKADLRLFFFIRDIKKPNLNKIGKVAFSLKKFEKIEIHSSRYIFVLGRYDELYHILNIDLASESVTESSEDEM